MKATIPQADLKTALQRIGQGCALNKRTLPALSGVRIDVDDAAGTVRLCATDLSVSMIVDLHNAQAHDGGQALVEHKALQAVASELGQGAINVSADGSEDGSVFATDGRTDVELHPLNLEDFPKPPEPTDSLEPFDDVLTHVPALLSATSSNDYRPALTGVCFDGGYVLATDSYRAVWVRRDTLVDGIVPGHALDAVRKAAGGRKPVPVSAGGGDHATFRAQTQALTITWVVRLIEGRFPEIVGKVVPESCEQTLTVDGEDLAASVDRLRKISDKASDRTAAPPVEVSHDGATLTLTVRGGDNAVRETLPADGAIPDMALNPRYLADAMRAVGSQRVNVETRDRLKPAVLTDADGESERRCLLMPVRL